MALTHRIATEADLPALGALMELAIDKLQSDVLTPEQVRASHAVMGLDTQLIADRTYFIVEDDGSLAGCGGWSARSTLYGGDHSAGRDAQLLDPAADAARVRAMYTHPDHVRKGVGGMILSLCEDAARNAGFSRVEMMATLAGKRLYEVAGYVPLGPIIHDEAGEVPVPLIRMGKPL